MKKIYSAAVLCLAMSLAGYKTTPAQAEDIFPTDSQIMTFNLGENIISLPMTQGGEPSVTQYDDRLIPRNTPGRVSSYGYLRPRDEAELLKAKVAEYYSHFRKDENGDYEPEQIGVYLSAELMQEITKRKELNPDSAIAFRIGHTFPDLESKAARSRMMKEYRDWFYQDIMPMKPDSLDMVAPTIDQATRWITKFRLRQEYSFSRVSVKIDDFTPFGEPLIFESGCNLDLYNLPGPYVGFCRITFYWKVDMFVTYDFDPTKRLRDTWRDRIHELYSALQYLEKSK